MSSLNLSPLQLARLAYQPQLPSILRKISELTVVPIENKNAKNQNLEQLAELFPKTYQQPFLDFQEKKGQQHRKLRVGVVLSGGQAPGGHNVISGLYDALKGLNADSVLLGFLNGPSGIINNSTVEITEKLLASYRNQGGFDIIGSGRTKIETPEQFKAAEASVIANQLDGLVVVGGDDSNTNAALLAEYFQSRGVRCSVIGVPKTIDGDLKNEFVEISFGFDSASKTYSEIIGNILRDALSAKKYYYFIKLMGRTASHITLECALQTHPNLAIIGEEVEAKQMTLVEVINQICDLICQRAEKGKNFGAILIPEGIVEFIPEVKQLIDELNSLLAEDRPHSKKLDSFTSQQERINYVMKYLSTPSVQCFKTLPKDIQLQLMLDRDPHGNVEVSKIETERLFIQMVKSELKNRKNVDKYTGKFSPQPLFCGYEGRSCLPSNFDCQYCYSLGYVAAVLIDNGVTGYMSCVQNLTKPVEQWTVSGIPLVSMMAIEKRKGKTKPVIRKALVDLEGKPFAMFAESRQKWMLDEEYRAPGPIQFFGPKEIADAETLTLQYER